MDPRGTYAPTPGNIHVHVYLHNIQTSSLKALDQSKPILCEKVQVGKDQEEAQSEKDSHSRATQKAQSEKDSHSNVYINNPCHMTKMGKKVQVGKDQEKAQSEKDSHSKNRGGKKPN